MQLLTKYVSALVNYIVYLTRYAGSTKTRGKSIGLDEKWTSIWVFAFRHSKNMANFEEFQHFIKHTPLEEWIKSLFLLYINMIKYKRIFKYIGYFCIFFVLFFIALASRCIYLYNKAVISLYPKMPCFTPFFL